MWYEKSISDVEKELNTNISSGLTEDEARKRLQEYGLNKLKEGKSKSLLSLILEQLNDVLIYILLGAAIISILLGEKSDAIIIMIVVVLNAVIGVIQESKAEKALEALKELSTPKAMVKRSNLLKEIPSEEVVPGDIIIIDAGRYIPCDLRLAETANLKIEEAAFTGESVPVEKVSDETFTGKIVIADQKNMAFMSTLATYGRGIGIATGTGMNTELGKIASMLSEEKNELTPLQKKLEELGKILGFGALGICAIMFIVGMLQGRDLFEMFLTSISLAVAAIPEGLPAIVTIVLALGVTKMIKKNAIVRKLPAVETLGSVNIICSDKTGTLTQNKMTVTKFYCDETLKTIQELNSNNPCHVRLIENMILCNDATYSENSKTGDPTEIALLACGGYIELFKESLDKIHQRVFEVPFDSDRKLMTTVNKYDEKLLSITKGATDNLLNICNSIYINGDIFPLTDDIKAEIMKAANSMSDDALRVLGTAFKELSLDSPMENLESDLCFVGLLGMIDPPRLEVKDSIATCTKAGIKTIMITGDHKKTAFAIAKELGIAESEDQAIFGDELDGLSDKELSEKIDNLRVFARVSPEHKVRIVKTLKSKGNIVSMTGDGVNDAPSLKAADIGVAMGITGTDVAKGAADLVLTDDNFSTIVKAVEEGRNIFNNIKKSILFLLSCNIGEIIALFFAILLGLPSPLQPIHILWVNLITDTLPALSLGVDPGDPDVMKEKPRDPKKSFLAGSSSRFIILNGLLIGLLSLTAFLIGLKAHMPNASLSEIFSAHVTKEALRTAQTMAFVVLSISQLFHSLNLRNETKSIFKIGFLSNKYLIGSIIIGFILQNIVIAVPFLANVFEVSALSLKDLALVTLLSISPLVLNEIVKLFKRTSKKEIN